MSRNIRYILPLRVFLSLRVSFRFAYRYIIRTAFSPFNITLGVHRMKKYFLAFAFVAVAAFAAVKFTTYADAGIETTIPADAKAMKLAETGDYSFDKAHSFIGFKVKHMGLVEVPGFFRDFTGTVKYDAADPAKSTVEFT